MKKREKKIKRKKCKQINEKQTQFEKCVLTIGLKLTDA